MLSQEEIEAGTPVAIQIFLWMLVLIIFLFILTVTPIEMKHDPFGDIKVYITGAFFGSIVITFVYFMLLVFNPDWY